MKKMRFTNKGQAALEFIMTYGWAILVVLVAIGALAYFGVLSPDRLLPNKCLLQSGLSCTDSKVSRNAITVRVTNSLGADLTNVTMFTYGCATAGAIPNNASSGPVTLNNGDSGVYTWNCATSLSGTKYSSSLSMTYNSVDSGIGHTINGTMIQRIE